MQEISAHAQDQAEQAFTQLPLFTDKIMACLLVIGVGSGALVQRLLQAYGPPLSRDREAKPRSGYTSAESKPWPRLPIWLVEPNANAVERAVRTFDWAQAISIEQLRVFSGPAALQDFCQANQNPLHPPVTNWIASPDTTLTQAQIQEIAEAAHSARSQRDQARRQQAEPLRARPVVAWSERYAPGKKLKILSIGTRFGVFVGHCGSSIARGFERQGHEVRHLIEVNDFQRVTSELIQQEVHDFAPDLIVSINYPRPVLSGSGIYTNGIPFCCWLQDPPVMDALRTPDAAAQHSDLDFYFSCAKEWSDELGTLGYGDIPTVKVPADPELFSQGSSSSQERFAMDFDISYVATVHPAAVENQFFDGETDPVSALLRSMKRDAYKQVEERFGSGQDLPSPGQYRRIALQYARSGDLSFGEDVADQLKGLEELAYQLESETGRLALRGIPIQWLQEAEHRVALFGAGWEKHPALSAVFRGPIPYGAPLAEMLRASRIHLCVHSHWTLTMKVVDCLTAGTFPLVRWVEPERETGPITDWYKEDRDVVLFRTREELLEKSRYYLEHPDERERIAQRGRTITLQHFTYDLLTQEMLSHIRTRLHG